MYSEYISYETFILKTFVELSIIQISPSLLGNSTENIPFIINFSTSADKLSFAYLRPW